MSEPQVKVVLTEDGRVETPWAFALGNNLYRLDNLPFWKYGVSLGDVIEARPDDSGRPAFVRVVRKSGNRTLRVVLRPPADKASDSQALLERLRSAGCRYEGMHAGYVAVNVPATVRLENAVAILEASGQEWESADPDPGPSHHEVVPHEA